MKDRLSYLILGLALLFVQSCIFDYGDVTPQEEGPKAVTVTFSVDVKNSTMTKADEHSWGDNLDEDNANDYPEVVGNAFENRINTSDLMVVAFTEAGDFVRELPILLCTENADGTVDFRCALDPGLEGTAATPSTYKFMVVANCMEYGLSYTAAGAPDLAGLIYSIPLGNAIPMWGVKTYTFKFTDGVVDETQELGDIYLLRAVAKIGVDLSDALKNDGYSISDLKLRYVGTNGYCLPLNWNATRYTESMTHAGAFRAYDSVLATDVNSWGTGVDSGMKYLYVPETANRSAEELSIAVTLSRTEGGVVVETVEFPYDTGIKFCYYSSGLPSTDVFNIVRNHFYEYRITGIKTGIGLALTLNVANWDVLSEDIEFTDEVTVSQQMTWAGTYLSPASGDGSVLYIDGAYTVADAVSASFKIDTPVGATWYASFEGDKDAFSFLVETTADDAERLDETTTSTEGGVTSTVYWKKVTSVSGVVGEASTLRVVTNSREVSENKSVSLKIVVLTMDGRTIIVNDLLMPEALSDKDYYQIRQNLS